METLIFCVVITIAIAAWVDCAISGGKLKPKVVLANFKRNTKAALTKLAKAVK